MDGFSAILLTFRMFVFFPIHFLGTLIIVYSYFLPNFTKCSATLMKIFSLFITILALIDPWKIFYTDRLIGYYVWAASLTCFTFAIWTKGNFTVKSSTNPRHRTSRCG
jgi:hypothetical protein